MSKNEILIKQEFSQVAFLQRRVETKPGELECLYSQCRYLLQMFDDCRAPIAVPWNDNVSAYCIVFAGERKRGRKQCDFAPKNTIHFVSKLIVFP